MRSGAVCLAVAAALAATHTELRTADACSCGVPAHATAETHPADGAIDVPTNANVLVVRQTGLEGVSLHHATTGDAVGISISVWQRYGGLDMWILADPAVELEPNTAYEVRADGQHASTFVTGAGPDTTPPAYAGITALALDRVESAESCSSGVCWDGNPLERLTVDFAPPPADAVMTLLRIRDADTGAAVMELPIRTNGGFAANVLAQHTCADNPPPIDPDIEYCAEVVVLDAAGNMGGEGVSVCSQARPCQVATCDDAFARDCASRSDNDSGGGCATSRQPTHGHSAVLLVLVALVVARRRRR